MSEQLRQNILCALAEPRESGLPTLTDVALAERTGQPAAEIRPELEFLEEQGWVRLSKARDGYAATITASGRLRAEELQKSATLRRRGKTPTVFHGVYVGRDLHAHNMKVTSARLSPWVIVISVSVLAAIGIVGSALASAWSPRTIWDFLLAGGIILVLIAIAIWAAFKRITIPPSPVTRLVPAIVAAIGTLCVLGGALGLLTGERLPLFAGTPVPPQYATETPATLPSPPKARPSFGDIRFCAPDHFDESTRNCDWSRSVFYAPVTRIYGCWRFADAYSGMIFTAAWSYDGDDILAFTDARWDRPRWWPGVGVACLPIDASEFGSAANTLRKGHYMLYLRIGDDLQGAEHVWVE